MTSVWFAPKSVGGGSWGGLPKCNQASRFERWLIMPPGWVARYEDNVWVVMRRQRRSAEDSGFGKMPARHVFLFPREAVCPACGLLNVLDTGPLRVEGKHRDDYREIPTDRPRTRQPEILRCCEMG